MTKDQKLDALRKDRRKRQGVMLWLAMAPARLGATQLRVMLYALARYELDEQKNFSHAEMAKHLRIRPVNLSRAFTALTEAGYFTESKIGTKKFRTLRAVTRKKRESDAEFFAVFVDSRPLSE